MNVDKNAGRKIGQINSRFERLVRAGRFDAINNALDGIYVRVVSTECLLAFLRATHAYKDKLPAWDFFYRRVVEITHIRRDWTPDLLTGLE